MGTKDLLLNELENKIIYLNQIIYTLQKLNDYYETKTPKATICESCGGSGEEFAGFSQMECDLKKCCNCNGIGIIETIK